MLIHFVTGNAGKLREVQALVPEVRQLRIDLPELQSMDPHVIIRAKLQAALTHHDGPLLVEDTSLHADGLQGLPGPLVKWFEETVGDAGIYAMAQASGNTRVTARVILGYAEHPDDVHFFEGTASGQLVAPRGSNGMGWDMIFQPDGRDRTFAEMTAEEKNAISMRRRAVEQLQAYLKGARLHA